MAFTWRSSTLRARLASEAADSSFFWCSSEKASAVRMLGESGLASSFWRSSASMREPRWVRQ